MERIARGIKKFILDNPEPFIIQCNHGGQRKPAAVGEPLATITGKHGYGVIQPVMAPLMGVNTSNHSGSSCRQPLSTVTTGGQQCLIVPTLIQYHSATHDGEARGQQIQKPLMTVDGSNRYGLVVAFLSKFFGGGYTGAGDSLQHPLPTVTAWDHNSIVTASLIVQHNHHCDGRNLTDPIPTITAGDGHFSEVRALLQRLSGKFMLSEEQQAQLGMVRIGDRQYLMVDIGLRMLEPRELYGCQGFPDDYIIDHDYSGKLYPRVEQVRRCGNAVCPPIPAALVRANLPELCRAQRTPNMRITAEQTGQLRFA